MDPTFALAPWVVLIPFIGILLNLILGKHIGEKGIGWIACLAAAGSFVIAVLQALALTRFPQGAVVSVADWISVGLINAPWAIRVDTLSVTMMLVVSGVGTLIHIYATAYMSHDVRFNGDPGRYRRFFLFFNLFIGLMMVLVSANNYLMMFVGWEGVGLCSYLLIGFWFEKGANGTGNAKAAKKAFIVNRIGDFGLLIAMFLLLRSFGTLDFDSIFSQAPAIAAAQPGVLLAITLLMLLAVTGKSAQLPLYVWLPDAMAGPTPVSALIHAATMVTAGVYLVTRSQALFALVPAAQSAVVWIGGLTALFAATIAVGQFDIKRVLAYSTISQLGFMVAAVGMGATVAGMFHLVTHAFFKALLFLSAGSVILAMEHGHEAAGEEGNTAFDPNDMRQMGGLRRKMPVTFWVYVIGALALAGIPPLAGFFSKDEILGSMMGTYPAVFVLLALATLLTAFYMGRQIVLVFLGEPRSPAAAHGVESEPLVTVPLGLLALLSVVGGALNWPGIQTVGKWLEQSIVVGVRGELQLTTALISSAVAILGLVLAWLAYRRPLPSPEAPDPLSRTLGSVFTGMNRKWYVDEFYQAVFVRPYDALGDFWSNAVDRRVINAIGDGLGSLTRATSQIWRRLQTGLVRNYALAIVVGAVVALTYLVLR